MASDLKTSLVQLCQYLQDPHHVARFQKFCGVRGTFSRNPAVPNELESARLLSNGACTNHYRQVESDNGTAYGEEKTEKTEDVRHRRGTSAGGSLKWDVCKNGPLNGVAKSPAAGDTEKGQSCASSRLFAGVSDYGQSPQTSSENHQSNHSVLGSFTNKVQVNEDANVSVSTVKPLRKNSLTGDAGQEFLIENKFLYYLFTVGTELGNELFYITFFPFFIWNVDAYVSRRLIVVWVWVMYLGQCTKDVIRWSRPASPPVVKVEMFYNSEYSMPSTHAMSGTAIPFSLLMLTCGRWEYPFILGLLLALSWCVLVCLSRIYMGMHSILDIIAGFLYSILILLVFGPALDPIDNFNLSYPYAPLLIVSLHVAMGLFSFTLDTWSTSRGDTAQILGTGAGVALASHLNHRLGLIPDPPASLLPLRPPPLSAALLGVALLRFGLGVLVLLATRALMKALTIPLVCRLFDIPSDDVRKARQHMEVELPYRYIVYGTVGFNALFLVPILFSCVGLS
ncbi:sphingosine-1-phosphate phosphatase 1 [Chanos chanos]|uniref:Sphingosine-1-phosphate phosphatase 1 n=1 Tax=Chanos chanos TaxID=29144 RepID=A0A6J2V4X2_CHACN|nr:sphingosine-1-phosphate phosphatase 1 [Chanos chanos]